MTSDTLIDRVQYPILCIYWTQIPRFNAKDQQLLVSTLNSGTGYLNGDGTLDVIIGGGPGGIEFLNLTQDNGIAVDNMYQSGKIFFRNLFGWIYKYGRI